MKRGQSPLLPVFERLVLPFEPESEFTRPFFERNIPRTSACRASAFHRSRPGASNLPPERAFRRRDKRLSHLDWQSACRRTWNVPRSRSQGIRISASKRCYAGIQSPLSRNSKSHTAHNPLVPAFVSRSPLHINAIIFIGNSAFAARNAPEHLRSFLDDQTVRRNMFRFQRNRRFQRAPPIVERLPRQRIDQIEIQICKAYVARHGNRLGDLFRRMNPADESKRLIVHRLRAERQPINACSAIARAAFPHSAYPDCLRS